MEKLGAESTSPIIPMPGRFVFFLFFILYFVMYFVSFNYISCFPIIFYFFIDSSAYIQRSEWESKRTIKKRISAPTCKLWGSSSADTNKDTIQ